MCRVKQRRISIFDFLQNVTIDTEVDNNLQNTSNNEVRSKRCHDDGSVTSFIYLMILLTMMVITSWSLSPFLESTDKMIAHSLCSSLPQWRFTNWISTYD